MSFKRFIVAAVVSLVWFGAHAGTKILDVELGVSTVEDVRKIASAAGKVQNTGTNEWTQGPSLLVQQGNYGIEGLQKVVYVFEGSNKLAAVILTMDKNRFGDIYDLLAGKYKLVKKVRPYVGNAYAKFSAPDATIEVDAPHLSFQMEVSYMTHTFVRAWEEGVKKQAQQKQSQEKSKF